MPFKIKKKGSAWQVVNSKTGRVAGWHRDKGSAQEHLKALYANVPDAGKIFNPAEHRVPGGLGGGRFAPGQVTAGRQPSEGDGRGGGGGGGGQASAAPGQSAPSRAAPSREAQSKNVAEMELRQAEQIEQQAAMLRAQIKWDQQEIRFQAGLGPAPTAPNPGVGRNTSTSTNTTGSAGHVGSAAVPGATSGSSAQRFSNTPQSTQQYIQFLNNDISQLRGQARQLDQQAEQLEVHAHSLLIHQGKASEVPDIIITASALQSLMNAYDGIK